MPVWSRQLVKQYALGRLTSLSRPKVWLFAVGCAQPCTDNARTTASLSMPRPQLHYSSSPWAGLLPAAVQKMADAVSLEQLKALGAPAAYNKGIGLLTHALMMGAAVRERVV